MISPLAGKETFHPATGRRQSIPRSCEWGDGGARGLWFQGVSTYGIGSHAAGSGLHQLTTHPLEDLSRVSGVFFKSSLLFGVGSCNLRPGLPETKTQLPKQPLALPHTQGDAPLLVQKRRQRLAVPQVAG